MTPLEPEIPPIGEEVHLPESSLLPLLLAVGITLALIGITISKILLIGGLILTVVVLVRWIRSTRSEIDELPPD
jgi:hypothetical protein